MPTSTYQPFHNESRRPRVFRVPFGRFAWVTVSMPLIAFVFCVVWSTARDFEAATSTHCQVRNVLPSISAAIGAFSPQKELWQLAIGLHAAPRFIVALVYANYHRQVLFPWAHCLAVLACLLNVAENLCLIGLSFWTSSDNYPVHKTCFVTFIVTSELYMVLTCLLLKRCRRRPPDAIESGSLRKKLQLLLFNVVCFLAAAYFFMRHNSYCEPGVYSVFALFEYLVVLSNMAFHMTAYWDFHERDLVLYEDCSFDLTYR